MGKSDLLDNSTVSIDGSSSTKSDVDYVDDMKEMDMKRVLVGLDNAPHSIAALETAVSLASIMRAEVVGVFMKGVANTEVQKAGNASPTTVKSLFVPDAMHKSWGEMDPSSQAWAARARRKLAELAGRAELAWRFLTTDNLLDAQWLDAAEKADLAVISNNSISAIAEDRSWKATAVTLLLEAKCLILLTHQKTPLSLPVVVPFDGSPETSRALVAARQMVHTGKGQNDLRVLILADNPEQARLLEDVAGIQIENGRPQADYHWLIGEKLNQLPQALARENCGMLVLSGSLSPMINELLLRLSNDVECAAMLVR
jgi:nucleotide-binding universal stress UspA family protein